MVKQLGEGLQCELRLEGKLWKCGSESTGGAAACQAVGSREHRVCIYRCMSSGEGIRGNRKEQETTSESLGGTRTNLD